MKKFIFFILLATLIPNVLLAYEVKSSESLKYTEKIIKEENKKIEEELLVTDSIKREYLRQNMLMASQSIVNNVYYQIDYRIRDNLKPKIKGFYDTIINRVVDSYKSEIIEINYIMKDKALVFVKVEMYDFEKILQLYDERYQVKLKDKGENITQEEEVKKMIETMDEMVKKTEKYSYTSNIQLKLAEKNEGVWKFTE